MKVLDITFMKNNKTKKKNKVMSHKLVKLLVLSLIFYFSLFTFHLFAQGVGINTTGAAADHSALLDLSSTTQGLLVPRMTSGQRDAITSPIPESLLIYNTDNHCFEAYNANTSAWVAWGCLSSCGSPFTDSRDGKSYKTVKIGSQCWMAENMNYGTCMPLGTPGGQTNNSIVEKYCVNTNGTDNYFSCTCPYGGLYEFGEAVQYLNGATNTTSWSPVPSGNVQGVCPIGWHIPTVAEWTILTNYLSANSTYYCGGVNTQIAKSMASTSGWNSDATICNVGNIQNTNNTSGFNAFPGGYSWTDSVDDVSFMGYWWMATEENAWNAWYMYLSYFKATVSQNSFDKSYGISVRCVRD